MIDAIKLYYEETELSPCPLCGKADYDSPCSACCDKHAVSLHWHGGNGKMRTYHYGCVLQAIADSVRRKQEIVVITNGENPPLTILSEVPRG